MYQINMRTFNPDRIVSGPNRFSRLVHGLDRLPPAFWLALLGAALWPHTFWMMRRMQDGSDDPLGVVALAALVLLGGRHRRHLRRSPVPAWFAAALVLALLATMSWQTLPPLVSSLFALLAFAAGMLALLPAPVAAAPVLGLALLSLPLMASLQFYAGYPLRVLVAELSRWLLRVGHLVEREGAVLWVDGQQILVDAACSGVQLVWFSYFAACATALLAQRSNASFLTRLPVVGLLALLGNVLRNTVLVAAQADGKALPHWAHEGIGLLALAVVCAVIVWWMQKPVFRREPHSRPVAHPQQEV